MATSNLAIPAAIVLSSVILASGLYFGLQSMQVAPTAAPATPSVTVPSPSVVQRSPAGLPSEVQTRGAENARQALEAMRGDIVAKCWMPAVMEVEEPRQIVLTFSMSFSPQGELGGVGISEDRGAARPKVADCVRKLQLNLRVPAPGGVLFVEVPFSLP